MEPKKYKDQKFFSLAREVEKLNQHLNSQRFRIQTIKPKKPLMSKWVPDEQLIKELLKNQYKK